MEGVTLAAVDVTVPSLTLERDRPDFLIDPASWALDIAVPA